MDVLFYLNKRLKASSSFSLTTFLNNRLLDASSLRESHLGLGAGTDDKDVSQTRGKGVPFCVLDGNN